MPEPTGSGSEAGSSTSQVTSQLAYLVPHFDPAKDDMLIYQQKVELVTAAWPKDKYVELVTRLILNCQGSAFQKLQLHQSELLSNDESSIQKLISLLGGSWRRIPLEKQFDEAEQALYHCQQKGDESNDSYLARSEILWSRLLARKLTLEDLQAFIVLRGSSLTPEDKKRVILESDRDSAGKLTSQKVSEAIRMLGANFFMDMTGQRRGKTKVYDQHALTVEDVPESADGLIAADEMTEEDFVDTLITEGEDEDAAMIADFEAAASDVIQEDLEMAQAFTAYMEARRRLSEKYRNRGFWPTSKGSNQFNKGKFSGSGGKSFGKGSKFGKGRKTLQDRILQSNCRACGRRGHWKAECPYKGGTTSQSGMSGNGSSTAPTTTLVTDLASSGADEALPLEFLGIAESDVWATSTFVSEDAEKLQSQKPNWVGSAMRTNPKDENPEEYSGEQVAVQVEDLSHLTLEELGPELVDFGQKHRGQSFHETWKDQEWVSWMTKHYGASTKTAHRRFIRYVELKLDYHEAHQMPIPVVPQGSLPMTTSGVQSSAKAGGPSPGMIAAKAKTRPLSQSSIHLPDMEDAGWALEPGTYTQGTMSSDPNVEAMQQRMLHLENALSRVIHHLEMTAGQTHPAQQIPIEETSDVESPHLG
ncbi:unnamed protein product [Cladocopium goreaui]|uniref:CCHC-type domain-containing protein n=1 Tax=Cladocopium goreaui TaxID=2562237 RepID=A0A9P1G1E8_9DINO|nr:unnamed protein product [Cladocopium goreaui]